MIIMNNEQVKILAKELKIIRAYIENKELRYAKVKLSNVIRTLEHKYSMEEES